jgi:hypothetical protein
LFDIRNVDFGVSMPWAQFPFFVPATGLFGSLIFIRPGRATWRPAFAHDDAAAPKEKPRSEWAG